MPSSPVRSLAVACGLAACLVAGLPAPARAQDAPVQEPSATAQQIEHDEQARLDACLALTDTDPDAAYEAGLAWLGQSGGRPKARFCTAMALVAKGVYDEGAYRLEMLANAPDAGSMEQRLVYLAQAGNAWIAAELPDEAIIALGNALKLAPKNPGLLVDRAAAFLMKGEAQRAIGDLNVALEQAPDLADALFLRARAFLANDQPELALSDIEAARAIEPANVDMVVLRGDIREAIRVRNGG